jgi:hypothetical protein
MQRRRQTFVVLKRVDPVWNRDQIERKRPLKDVCLISFHSFPNSGAEDDERGEENGKK